MLRLEMRRVLLLLLLLVLQAERQILVLREGSRRRRGRGSGEVGFSDGMDIMGFFMVVGMICSLDRVEAWP